MRHAVIGRKFSTIQFPYLACSPTFSLIWRAASGYDFIPRVMTAIHGHKMSKVTVIKYKYIIIDKSGR